MIIELDDFNGGLNGGALSKYKHDLETTKNDFQYKSNIDELYNLFKQIAKKQKTGYLVIGD